MSGTQRVALHFYAPAVAAQTHVNLSAVRADGDCLWLAGDETATVERLVGHPHAPEYGLVYGDQREFRVADYVDLPGEPDAEADLEGLARSGGYLWAVGSHSVVRKRVRPHHSAKKAIRRLGSLRVDPNRYILARFPVAPGPDGLPELARATSDGRTAAVFGGPGDPNLVDLLVDDVHLGPFLRIPAKDNGLDVEGLAVHGETREDQTLYIGLRGPVLRGFAVLLEVRPVDAAPGRLALAPVGDHGAPYRKHFLDLGGLGVRDLCPHGRDLLVLAGPSMDLDGPVRLYRWHGAASTRTSAVARGDELTPELELPYGDGDDHAEGITLLPDGRLLVVYDSPAAHRMTDEHTVHADVIALPGRPAPRA